MGQNIAVSKAAKLLGIKRSELNKRLLAADIPTFEGVVDLERVKCIAPGLDLKGEGVHEERVRYFRENATKPKRDSLPHRPRDLEAEIRHLSAEVMIEAQMAAHYRLILEDIGRKLGELQMAEHEGTREAAFEICQWLRTRITEH